MPRVVVEMSLSLDGYIAGPGDAPGHAFGGRGAHRLHDWLLVGPEPYERNAFFRPQGRNREFVETLFETTGALLTGRRTYDLVNGWGGSHPIPGLPVVVLTHAPPSIVPQGTSAFTFCRNVREAVDVAKGQAEDKDVMVHGAATTQQLLAAGLVDELRLHIAPLLLGDGRRLFERSVDDLPLEMIETVATPQAVHVRYRVIR
ncbi:MAG TPA: dihydrofolate reductase family protein [Steroidobacteraceae bacterium]|jgi:dihydrofolate reductase|nr:dihydrofolate reductase family protein [Steroidobacteraceae bacterium]